MSDQVVKFFELGEMFLEEAKTDIDTAKVLIKSNEERLARRAVFHMQQASEKIIKALALIVTSDNLNVAHTQPLNYAKQSKVFNTLILDMFRKF